MPSVLITGASGLLGRATSDAFTAAGWAVTACGWSRATPDSGLTRLDVRDAAAIDGVLDAARPDVIVHSAAERRPDACENAPSDAEALNIDAVFLLGRAAARRGCVYIYVSTDYIFNGAHPPYRERDEALPLNAYGEQKLRGEHAALAAHPRAIIVRVPVLYGPTKDLRESAVTAFAAVVRDEPSATVDAWQIRVPTYTPDVGATLERIASACMTGGADAPRGIYHYSSLHKTTRWDLCVTFARLLGDSASVAHIKRIEGAPPGAPRPHDCMLDCARIEGAGLAAPHTPLEVGLRAVLAGVGIACVAE